MRRLTAASIAAVCIIALTQIACAAPINNWSGLYIGIAGGYGWGNSNQTDPGIGCSFFKTCTDDTSDGSYAVRGGILGGGVGFNWQLARWVYGVEGDYSWADISGSSNTCGAATPIPHPCGTDLQSLGTLRARIGYALGVTGNWLPYVTGGLAVGEVHAWDALFPSSGSDFRAGWTVGGGVETAIMRNWTFKVEYLYVDLGSRETFNVVPGVPETVKFTTNILRAGINYKFGYTPIIITK
jgi:outer membrane immunogenic protein